MTQAAVSVIVPVYNAESTVEECVMSLLAQTFRNLELVFVDDCSQDGTTAVIHRCLNGVDGQAGLKYKVVRHEINRGVAAARDTGLAAATGRYVYWVDADDRIEPDALRQLVAMAEERDADIVGHHWYLTFKNNERLMKQPVFSTPDEALRQMMGGAMRWNLWLFLFKRELFEANDIRFIPGMDMGEDMMVTIKLFAKAERVAILEQPLYHYNQTNQNSLTKTYSQDHIRQVTENLKELERFFRQNPPKFDVESSLASLKLNIKLPLLISDKPSNYAQWRAWFPEANKWLWNNKFLPLRTRLLQYFAVRKWDFLLKLYYRLVFKFLYGVIYK